MPAELLLDAGALVSILDRSQPQHLECADYFRSWTGEVVSTEAVLTGATHLLSRIGAGPRTCLDFFLRGGAVLVPTSTAALSRCRELMDQYSDLPMDYADATLVALAEDLSSTLVMTTDRRDFGVYRVGGRTPFQIVPA